MNNLIKELAEQALRDTNTNGFSDAVYRPHGFSTGVSKAFVDQFAQLIISEHTKVLQQEWYRLNNLSPVSDESSRDVALRVGKKIQTVLLIERLRKHFKANDE